MMMILLLQVCHVIFLILASFTVVQSAAWVAPQRKDAGSGRRFATTIGTTTNGQEGSKIFCDEVSLATPRKAVATTTITTRRRDVIHQGLTLAVAPACAFSMFSNPSSAAAEARCDASDRRCGPDGKLRTDDEQTAVKPIPKVTNRITHVVQLVIFVGERREETGAIRFGLYGDDCPANTRRMLEFLTSRGITGVVNQAKKEDEIGLKSAPVTLLEGGIVPNICSGTAVDFGVPSQSKAYAISRGLVKAGDNFVPQSRPSSEALEPEPFPRPHDVAGLVSVPLKGIGYGGDVSSLSDDEAFSSAFLITADAAPALDKDNNRGNNRRRRVIGQVIDDESMKFLNRLATLPTQKKGLIKEVIPGESSGPPLLKVTIRDIGVQKVPPPQKK